MDRDVECFTCPVLAFTPQVEAVLQWFALTHVLQGGFGWVLWQRVALPEAGGVGDQPARLMEALGWVGQLRNAALAQQSRSTDRRRRKATRH